MTQSPYIDAWRTALIRTLAPRGTKAKLALHLSTLYGSTPRYWQAYLQKILKPHHTADAESNAVTQSPPQLPNGELVLAINDWVKTVASGQ